MTVILGRVFEQTTRFFHSERKKLLSDTSDGKDGYDFTSCNNVIDILCGADVISYIAKYE